MVTRRFWILCALGTSALPTVASAQDAAIQPNREVRTAAGPARPVASQSARHTAATPRDWTLRLRTANGRCYRVIGLAVGASRVTTEVIARATRVGDALLISTSNERVANANFCATLPGNVYAVRVHADGPTNWSLSVIDAPADAAGASSGAGTGTGSGTAAATGTTTATGTGTGAGAGAGGGSGAGVAGMAGLAGLEGVPSGGVRSPTAGDRPPERVAPPQIPQFPVGGTENDYVAQQIRTFAQSRVGARPVMPVNRGVLQTSQTREMNVSLNGGPCIEVVAAAVPSASDVDVEIYDPAGNRVAQDTQHRPTESVRFCPSYTGSYRVTVRMFSGFGLTGVQAFLVR